MKHKATVPRKRLARRLESQSLALLDDMKACRQRIVAGLDEDALHDYRVDTRRLCSLLVPFQNLAAFADTLRPLKRLRKCMRHSNAVRDVEVQNQLLRECANELPIIDLAPWLIAFDQRQMMLYEELKRDLESSRNRRAARRLRRHLPTALSHYDAHTLQSAVIAYHAHLLLQIDQHLLRGQALFDESATWHALRLDCKKLRYLCECHGRLLGNRVRDQEIAARRVQDALGNMRDMDLLIAMIAEDKSSNGDFHQLLTLRRKSLATESESAVASLAHLLWTDKTLASAN